MRTLLLLLLSLTAHLGGGFSPQTATPVTDSRVEFVKTFVSQLYSKGLSDRKATVEDNFAIYKDRLVNMSLIHETPAEREIREAGLKELIRISTAIAQLDKAPSLEVAIKDIRLGRNSETIVTPDVVVWTFMLPEGVKTEWPNVKGFKWMFHLVDPSRFEKPVDGGALPPWKVYGLSKELIAK